MASSSSSPPELAFSTRSCKYHVFLSFRGEDTRKNFVDHLYTALVHKGIYTYKDDETFPRGESIGPSLMKAIEESQIAVIIFSVNYADSSWCLDELAYIMKCKDRKGQIVLPIFYDVEPSTVRKQKHKYGEAFSKHELENNKNVEYWKKALVDAGNLSGWETKHMANGHESKVIQEIVGTISHRLHPLTSSADEKLIGIEARKQDLKSILEIGSGGVRMIGIWGVGGGGKTTLALSVYDEISSKFDACCFVENVREESSRSGLEKLQEKILSNVLTPKEIEANRVGTQLVKDRFCHIKMLMVLDDVDHLNQLKMLAGSHDWFGEGSRIIITTRDQHLLSAHRVDVIHNIRLLNNDDATKLFRKHAPQDYRPMEDYELLSKHVVSYAGGLPLALTVLGCFLCDKDINEWRSALARLKEIPETDIVGKLRISYDGLKLVEKELFLHIACFFRGRYKNGKTMAVLDACGLHPVIGIKVLIQKALITISGGKFDMHDLVQEMGHYMVRGKHPKHPEKHSRVWSMEDVLEICAMDATKEINMVEAIRFERTSYSAVELFPPIVANMKNLRLIDWRLDLASPFPANFPPGELCCLILYDISQEQLWKGYKFLPNLRMIKLDKLNNLMKTPDFDGLPNLERFMVNDCPLLEEIHPSFGRLENLVSVEIIECENLKMLPPITQSKKLENLVLIWYKSELNLSEMKKNMENFVPHKINHIGQWFFSGYCLRKLNLCKCNLADEDIIRSAGVWELPNLQELSLEDNGFVRLSFSLLRLPRLKYLNLSRCKKLVELSDLPSSIAVVIADFCDSLESFGDVSNCEWLWKVSVQGDNVLCYIDELGPSVGDILLDLMLKGNAKDHFINIFLSCMDIGKGSILWLDGMETFTMPLSHDWYNEYCGLLMFVECDQWSTQFDITIKQGVDKDFHFELAQESNETFWSGYGHTIVGYVSFSSLRHTGCLNSTYNIISFSVRDWYNRLPGRKHRFRVVLVPKDDPMQTPKVATDPSDFWETPVEKAFRIHRDSDSSVSIFWNPHSHITEVFNAKYTQ